MITHRTLDFKVVGQTIENTNSIDEIVGNTSDYLIAYFELDEMYNNMMVAAVFTTAGQNYAMVLDKNNQVRIPREVLVGESFSVGVYAGAGEGVITTNTVDVPLSKSVRTRFVLNKSYMELYTQLTEEFDDFVNGANGILNEHIEKSTQTDEGVHDLRVVNGIFQYLNHDTNEWEDASTGELTNIIANNLSTSNPGKVLDAYQGYLLGQNISEYEYKHREIEGRFCYFSSGLMTPVANKSEIDNLSEDVNEKGKVITKLNAYTQGNISFNGAAHVNDNESAVCRAGKMIELALDITSFGISTADIAFGTLSENFRPEYYLARNIVQNSGKKGKLVIAINGTLVLYGNDGSGICETITFVGKD